MRIWDCGLTYGACYAACSSKSAIPNPKSEMQLTPSRIDYLIRIMNTHNPLTIAAFQQHIRDRYYPTDKARGTPGTFMWFIEEIGELATALHESNKPDADPATLAAARANLEEEFADVIAWLCTLANINEVDLADALHRKYLAGSGPEGHK